MMKKELSSESSSGVASYAWLAGKRKSILNNRI
jgi:hypothetical protein